MISPILTIVKTNTNSYATVTGIRHPEAGEPQVFLRTLDAGKPLQTTESMLEHSDLYTIVGHWRDPDVKAEVNRNVDNPLDPVELKESDDLPLY